MANSIRIRTSVEFLQDVGIEAGTIESQTYTNLQHDKNADGRAWGGRYDTLTAYTDADLAYWKQAVITATSADGLNDSGWTEASDVTAGTIPTTAHVVVVEYTGELGTVGTVSVTINTEVHAALDLGESIVIPLSAGEVVANVKIHAGAYSNGVNEATVNVCIAGV